MTDPLPFPAMLRPRTARAPIATAALFLLAATAPASAQYALASGDTVEMSVVGFPDIRQRSVVDVDGRVSLPLVGSIEASGLTITALRARVQESIARKPVRQRNDDGRESSVFLEPDEVTLDIAEYRPIYVNGDVSKPGEVRFRSSLSVRQAVALAGGYDLMRFRLDNPFLQVADLEGDRRAQAADVAQKEALVARLEAELGEGPGLPSANEAAKRSSASSTLTRNIFDLETERLRLRMADLERQSASLKTLIRFGDQQLASLGQQSSREEDSSRLDEEELQRSSTQFERGNLTINRVVDARRVMLLGSTRLLQTKVQIEKVRREREVDERTLKSLEADRRLDVVAELQTARVSLEAARAKLAATEQKLLYSSSVRSQLVKGAGGRPNVVVFRANPEGKQTRIDATEDTSLRPGDTVEVSLVAALVPSDQPSR